jgi:hypothetical protein
MPESGMAAYISKPIEPAQLFKIVEQTQPGSHVGTS